MTYKKNSKILQTIVPQALMVFLLLLLNSLQTIHRHPLPILSTIVLKLGVSQDCGK